MFLVLQTKAGRRKKACWCTVWRAYPVRWRWCSRTWWPTGSCRWTRRITWCWSARQTSIPTSTLCSNCTHSRNSCWTPGHNPSSKWPTRRATRRRPATWARCPRPSRARTAVSSSTGGRPARVDEKRARATTSSDRLWPNIASDHPSECLFTYYFITITIIYHHHHHYCCCYAAAAVDVIS